MIPAPADEEHMRPAPAEDEPMDPAPADEESKDEDDNKTQVYKDKEDENKTQVYKDKESKDEDDNKTQVHKDKDKTAIDLTDETAEPDADEAPASSSTRSSGRTRHPTSAALANVAQKSPAKRKSTKAELPASPLHETGSAGYPCGKVVCAKDPNDKEDYQPCKIVDCRRAGTGHLYRMHFKVSALTHAMRVRLVGLSFSHHSC
jgi:hypothetical protein